MATTVIWGRPYPISTDSPNVHTDIQALANSMETVPLHPTTAVASRSLIAGESVAISASQTGTLPSAPVKGDMIRVAAAAGVTGATPVTVAASGGKGINGKGLSVASSFPLGTAWAHATLQYDGSNWQIVDGEQNSGFVALTLGTNVTSNDAAEAPAVRLRGDKVEFCGQLSLTGVIAANATMLTMPSVCNPVTPNQVLLGVFVSGGTPNLNNALVINNGSNLVKALNGYASGQIVAIEGLNYRR